MKRKVLFIFGALGGGGAQRQFGWLIEGIDKQLFEPVIITIGPNENKAKNHLIKYPDTETLDECGKKEEFEKFFLYRKLLNTGVKKHFIERKGYFYIFKNIRKILKLEKPGVILNVTPMAMTYSFLPSLFGSAKVIHGVRGNGILLSYKKNIYNVFHFLSQMGINYFVCNSNGLAKNIQRNGYHKNKIKVIYNGIPTFFDSSFNDENTSPPEMIRIGLIGRFTKVKDHEMFIDAIHNLNTTRNFSVHLYGSGELEAVLQNKINELGLERKVIIEGWVSNVSGVLKTIDIVCLTSRFEGFNNAISEAQMHGIPVVTTNCIGSDEIVADGKTGFIVPIKDDKEFSKKLQLLIDDDVLRINFSKNAYQRSRVEFGIPKMVKRYESFFTEIL
ncbi:glycosyltransferase [Lutimonas vermicola]|uniref:Glycosyltransferase n=1 Tax=Lutimonas vermicola TaxID=414288 RepID=A0ABU9L410_9FLAO